MLLPSLDTKTNTKKDTLQHSSWPHKQGMRWSWCRYPARLSHPDTTMLSPSPAVFFSGRFDAPSALIPFIVNWYPRQYCSSIAKDKILCSFFFLLQGRFSCSSPPWSFSQWPNLHIPATLLLLHRNQCVNLFFPFYKNVLRVRQITYPRIRYS